MLGRRQTEAKRTNMGEPVWEFQHSARCNATRQFAWKYWTNVANWNDPPAKFELDGQFAAGSRLTTTLLDQTWHSVIREVDPGREATIEMELPGAVLSFHWRFADLANGQTQITQRLVLKGPDAKSFVAQASIFERSVPQGMEKLLASIERARTAMGSG